MSDRYLGIRLAVVGVSFIVATVAMGLGSRRLAILFGAFGTVMALLTALRLMRD